MRNRDSDALQRLDEKSEAAPSASNPTPTTVTLRIVFAVYLGILVWTVVWKLHVPFVGPLISAVDTRAIKLVPFVANRGFGASAPFEVAMNALIFIPFGAYLAVTAPRWALWRIAATAAVASLGLESLQFVLVLGRSDITDVIMNAVGAVAGAAVLGVMRRALRERTEAVTAVLSIAGTVAVLVAVLAYGVSSAELPAVGPGMRGSVPQ